MLSIWKGPEIARERDGGSIAGLMGASRETSLSSHNKWDCRNEQKKMSSALKGSRTAYRKGQSRDVAPGRAGKGPSWSLRTPALGTVSKYSPAAEAHSGLRCPML